MTIDRSDITPPSSNNDLQEGNNLDCDSDSGSGYSVKIPSSESIDLDNIEEKNSEPSSESIDLNHSDITLSNLKKEENKQLKEEENSLEESSKELTEKFVTRDTEDKNIIFH
ncbi:MAG: hypothetical protein J6C50_03285 [Rickettsiales bacterium]|nr:hypothetical protein [Rickettsiales bacterium]